ncbi:MAG TPA: 3-methyl-2-indolic acid synthase [Nitrospira sp.]
MYHETELLSIAEEAARLRALDLNELKNAPVRRAAKAAAAFELEGCDTDELAAVAAVEVTRAQSDKRTFVPIFMTNYCDSECLMCGMRKGNQRLRRKFSGRKVIEEQLTILRDFEGVRGVGFLTGEYEGGYVRRANAFMVGWAIRRALDMGFQQVYFNIGSLDAEEIEVLAEWVERDEPVTMCVFQETYERSVYHRFMGGDTQIPKADFDRRIASFDQWLSAGFRQVNPGVLVGLADPKSDLLSLAAHIEYLVGHGAAVEVSLPRLRPALGSSTRSRVDDDTYLRLIAAVAFAFPECRIVLTTRETEEFQQRALPLVGVISPGSPDVAPYLRDSAAANDELSSQFLIPDLRRPREILTALVRQGYSVTNFAPLGPIP